ncbi:MAG: DnaD domain protein [Clostridia bacterium]|nr:DnaD domain protein [Clostridia bacterium]
MMFSNKEVDGVFVMPKSVLSYMNNAKKVELRLIMYIFAEGDGFSVKDAASDLGESEDMINSALAFWRGTGIITETKEGVKIKKQVTSQVKRVDEGYSTLDVANATMNDDEFRQIVKFAEKTLGDLPNASKQAQLYYLYDNLGMQSDVIMGIIAHCAAMGKTRYDYIKKTAEGIHNDGVVTYKELECYIKAKEDSKQFEAVVKRIIGAGERAFTKSEKALVEKWEREWEIGEELLYLAYERTITLISKPSLPYMSKILEGWYKEGIKTAEDAEKMISSQTQKTRKALEDEKTLKAEKAKKAGFDFDFEDIFEKP